MIDSDGGERRLDSTVNNVPQDQLAGVGPLAGVLHVKIDDEMVERIGGHDTSLLCGVLQMRMTCDESTRCN